MTIANSQTSFQKEILFAANSGLALLSKNSLEIRSLSQPGSIRGSPHHSLAGHGFAFRDTSPTSKLILFSCVLPIPSGFCRKATTGPRMEGSADPGRREHDHTISKTSKAGPARQCGEELAPYRQHPDRAKPTRTHRFHVVPICVGFTLLLSTSACGQRTARNFARRDPFFSGWAPTVEHECPSVLNNFRVARACVRH